MKKLNDKSKLAEVFLKSQKLEGFFLLLYLIIFIIQPKKSIPRLLLGGCFKLSGDDLAHHEMFVVNMCYIKQILQVQLKEAHNSCRSF